MDSSKSEQNTKTRPQNLIQTTAVTIPVVVHVIILRECSLSVNENIFDFNKVLSRAKEC
jgi:hypothetical protein